MKCPKCGYLGFETTDRCRNCQYDFSLAPFTADPELTLQGADQRHEDPNDFELPPIRRQTDSLSSTALDLDRLFGDAVPNEASAAPVSTPPAAAERTIAPVPVRQNPVVEEEQAPEDPFAELIASLKPAAAPASPALDETPTPPDLMMPGDADAAPDESSDLETPEPAEPEGALPFDDGPLVPPPAARTPLAVRRSTPEVPRNRPRTTRPVRAFDFDDSSASKSADAARDATDTIQSLMEPPSLGVRVGAGLIDLLLLVSIDALILYLTLRVTGLQNTVADLRVLPPIPFVGFLALLGFGYMAAFTVAGGQTIGKMMLNLRVIGDDGRPVDAAGGVLRALGCMLVPLTLGLSYLPALFTSDHRALHDRLAGTRVVQE